jgi:hypothetical protein
VAIRRAMEDRFGVTVLEYTRALRIKIRLRPRS